MEQNFDPKKGTTTVGLVGKDGVVLAADMRASMGYFIANREVEKIHKLDEHVGMTIAGSVGDAQALVRYMQAELKLFRLQNGQPMPVKGVSTLLSNILFQQKFFPFLVQLLVAGYDEKGGSIYNLDPVGGVTTEKCTSTGSGSPTALGYLESVYKEDMKVDELLPIAARAIAIAMKRDIATGDGIALVSITSKGYRSYSKEEVQSLLSSH
ncbi:MAG: archaeal proteasome endopeptidase complex subunit beta [Candidatus Micrarchaeota archaeon]|nr:archaeal proteasome endopeptidase complex subunit beta [Candidatus Micrarchaeota archaeon]